jgi:septal ring factor EnvC (AmiA/AmiB activator)
MRRYPIAQKSPMAAAAVLIAALAILAASLSLMPGTARATGGSLGRLSSELGANQVRQQSLSTSLRDLDTTIVSLSAQIALVQRRQAAVQISLTQDRARLVHARTQVARERAVVARLKARLHLARTILARQLVSSYESSRPDLMSVVLSAHGFTQLLEQLNFLGRAQSQQQQIIVLTRRAKAQADVATVHLTKLQQIDAAATQAATLQARALAGMNALLDTRQQALGRARAAQQAALAASQVRAGQLRSAIARVRAQQAAAAAAARAAAAAAAARAAAQASPSVFSTGPALGPSGGWAIPYAIVLCESGGQNLPPNSAGASGYYQIVPGTWRLFGGTGPAAYLASKSEQDAVAAKIWNGGAGASNWVCAGIVGIH